MNDSPFYVNFDEANAMTQNAMMAAIVAQALHHLHPMHKPYVILKLDGSGYVLNSSTGLVCFGVDGKELTAFLEEHKEIGLRSKLLHSLDENMSKYHKRFMDARDTNNESYFLGYRNALMNTKAMIKAMIEKERNGHGR